MSTWNLPPGVTTNDPYLNPPNEIEEQQAAQSAASVKRKPHTRRTRKEGGKAMAKKERKLREQKPMTADKLAIAFAPMSVAERKAVVKAANRILKLASRLSG